jgi:hypothetical protein
MGRFFIIFLMVVAGRWELMAQPTSPLPGQARIELPPTPPVPTTRTPVDYFRELLALSPAEREKALTNRSVQTRAFLEGKLKEFEALPPASREARLQTLQVRWLLLPLMKTKPAQREARLAAMSEADRRLVVERLEQWDLLTEDLQRKVLENENVIRVFFRAETNATPDPAASNLTPAQRDQLQAEHERWNGLPEEEQGRVLAHFDRFFGLSSKEKARIVDGMSDAERRQMELALQSFGRLPKPQREACLRGFKKFVALTPEEQQEFLTSAERWQSISPSDRQLWRSLVVRLHPKPPLPPGAAPKAPPMPPGAKPRLPIPTKTGVATN